MSGWRWWLTAGLVVALAGCGGMVGVYRGPEPFGGKEYAVSPPKVTLSREVRVVVLMLADERPAMEHDLDWVRQSHSFSDNLGQPAEVRTEFDRAIKSGLSASRRIRLVAPETFLQTRDADLIISGRILRCEAERKMGWLTADFHGRAEIEIVLRSGEGKSITESPLEFESEVEIPWKPPASDARVDEIPVGYAASAVEKAIRQVAESFLTSSELADALLALN
ncbi:MAG: hypothetical protein HY885_14100 [Deltaproteobacteria bacterium]|nr:hypothetical protein [Deltaproteobacteria bacterium]